MIVVAQCRADFEAEAAIDITRTAAAAGLDVACAPQKSAGYVVARAEALDLRRWRKALVDVPPVFVRSIFVGSGPHRLTDVAHAAGQRTAIDRVTPLLAAIESLAVDASDLWMEYPDTNDGKAISTLARALAPRIESELRRRGRLLEDATTARGLPTIAPRNRKRLHVFLPDGATAYVGVSIGESGSPWPMGIARLRMPNAAPSRSVLKLAEALITFLGEAELTRLRAGMRAVDLGAAPGGWSWLLASRGLRVTAVDNGALKGEVAQDPLVTHVRDDGLRFRPKRNVDWVTCDIVEQPIRIATLMAEWIGEGHARQALFNLKLPMKKRYAEIDRCRELIERRLQQTSNRHRFSLKQLYHDRQEVTAYIEKID